METTTKPEKLHNSVLKKEPQSVIEVPPKKVVLVKEKSSEEKPAEEPKQIPDENMMEVDNNEDVIGPSNQT